MAVEDVLHDGKPKTRAALLPTRRHIDAVEPLRQPREMLRSNTWSVVDHGDGIAPRLPSKRGDVLRLDAHLPAPVTVFQRVLHEVLQDLKQLVAIAAHDRGTLEASNLEAEAHLAGKRIQRILGVVQD